MESGGKRDRHAARSAIESGAHVAHGFGAVGFARHAVFAGVGAVVVCPDQKWNGRENGGGLTPEQLPLDSHTMVLTPILPSVLARRAGFCRVRCDRRFPLASTASQKLWRTHSCVPCRLQSTQAGHRTPALVAPRGRTSGTIRHLMVPLPRECRPSPDVPQTPLASPGVATRHARVRALLPGFSHPLRERFDGTNVEIPKSFDRGEEAYEMERLAGSGAERNPGKVRRGEPTERRPGGSARRGPYLEGVMVMRDGVAKPCQDLSDARARKFVRRRAVPRIPPCRRASGSRCRSSTPRAAPYHQQVGVDRHRLRAPQFHRQLRHGTRLAGAARGAERALPAQRVATAGRRWRRVPSAPG